MSANVQQPQEGGIQEQRKQRLAAWIEAKGGAAQVVRDRRLPSSQVSYISQLVGGYSFGERAARSMEQKLGMPAGYLDQSESDIDMQAMLAAYRELSPEARAKAQAFVAGLAAAATPLEKNVGVTRDGQRYFMPPPLPESNPDAAPKPPDKGPKRS